MQAKKSSNKVRKRPVRRRRGKGGEEKEKFLLPAAPADYRILISIALLILIGLVMIYSSSYFFSMYGLRRKNPDVLDYAGQFFMGQAKFALMGFAILAAVSYINPQKYRVLAPFGLILAFGLILLLLTGFGTDSHNATRWLKIGPITFQVAEPVKLFLILYLANYGARKGFRRIHLVIPLLIIFALSGMLYKITSNLSSASIVLLIGIAMIYVLHPSYKLFTVPAVIAVIVYFAGIIFLMNMDPSVQRAGGFRMQRIFAWLHPDHPFYIKGKGFQLANSLFAIGSGGFFGKGLGRGVQKFMIPELHTDFILANIAEELGLFGVILVVLIYVYLIYRIFRVAFRCHDSYSLLITVGVAAQLMIQVLANIAVVSGAFPTTGVNLPFVSQGGTTLIIFMAEIGLVLAIDRRNRVEEVEAKVAKELRESGFDSESDTESPETGSPLRLQ